MEMTSTNGEQALPRPTFGLFEILVDALTEDTQTVKPHSHGSTEAAIKKARRWNRAHGAAAMADKVVESITQQNSTLTAAANSRWLKRLRTRHGLSTIQQHQRSGSRSEVYEGVGGASA